jgi:PAS domain S-box-containing protein
VSENHTTKKRNDSILIVDDESDSLRLLADILSRAGYHVRPADRPKLALKSAIAVPPVLILLDVRMPEMDGFEFSRQLKQNEESKNIPIIFVSGLDDVKDRVQGFMAGGADFISKPYQEAEILARVRTHINLRRMQLNMESMVLERTAELSASELRFRATFEQAAVGIAHVSLTGRFLRVNQKFCNIIGYTQDELLGLTFQEITYPDDLDVDLDYVQQLLVKKRDSYSMEKRSCRKDGSIVWINLTVSLLLDRGGNPKYYVFVIEDISDRKQAEQDLIKANINYRMVADYTYDWEWWINPDGSFRYVSPACARVTGYKAEAFLENCLLLQEIILPEDLAKWEKHEQGSAKETKQRDMQFRIKRADGEVRWIEHSCRPVFTRENEFLGLRACNRDITDRKLTSDALSRSEKKFRALVDNSLVGVFNTSLDGKFLFVNDALARMYDFDSPEQMVVEGSLPRWVDPQNREQLMSDLQEHGSVSNFEAETITASGRHIHVLFSVKLQDGVITGMVMDISKRKQSEQRIFDYQQRLKVQATQLTLVEEQERRRIATELHDNVGQTLALSRLQLAVASKAVEDDALKEQFDELSQTLLTAVKDTRHLIFELSSPTLHELGLGAAISEWIELKVKPQHNLDIKLVDNIELSNLSLDQSTIMFRSVRELLTNIVKYARADKASVLIEEEGGSVWITVKDNGIGFNPYQVRRNVSSDGGLGLFSIEERMNDFGGSMVIDSRAHHGTTIVLTVPCSEIIKEKTT